MEFLSAIVTKMLEYTVQPVGHQLGYLFHHGRNVRKLKDELRALELHKDRIRHQVGADRSNGEVIYEDVQDWLNRADSVISEEDRAVLLNEEHHANGRCSSCSFPNLVLRYKLSKQAKEIANRASKIKGEGTSFVTVSYRRASQNSIVVDKDYKGDANRKLVLDRVMNALKSPDVKMIGLYGMGGVGKTTLAKEIARQAKDEEMLFDKVIMVTVSQTLDHEKIQREIAENLGLDLSKETQNSTRANRLRERLRQEKKILIILDDVWKKFDLFEVGIHFNDDQKGCKILMTSRRLVLFQSMDVEEKFFIEALPETEAAELFREIVGDSGKNPQFSDLLTDVVKECGGLPLVVKTVACALKDKPVAVWENALNDLRSCAPQNIEELPEKVYSCLKMSYDFLQSEEAKSLLLLCGMFPEDKFITADHLLMYSVGWGLLENAETLEKARNKVYSLIDILRDNCLLLPSDKSPFDKEYHWVKVHDVIREVAISIAKEKGWFNISSITQLEERPLEENPKVPIAISLLGDFSSQLPKSLLCPQLQSFIVHSRFNCHSSGLSTIPDCFFEENKKLGVLDLPHVRRQSPPSPFSCLSDSLRTLRLSGCHLEDTTFIGGLKQLKCLDLSWSRFKKLSKQIGQLTRLQLLALDYCRDLKVIEPTVISSLANLEELYMREVEIKWEVESDNNDKGNASLAELKNLGRLNTLCISIEEADVMPKDLFTKKLKRYEIIVGPELIWRYAIFDILHEKSSCSKVLDLELNEGSLLYSSGLEKLIEESEDLRLSGLIDMEEIVVCKRDDGIKFPELRSLSLEKLPKLVQFSRSLEWETASCSSAPPNSSLPLFNDKVEFPNLEILKLWRCGRLKTLFMSSSVIFTNLGEIRISECHEMINVLASSTVKCLVQLKTMSISECYQMTEIIVDDKEREAQNTEIAFTQLETLVLHCLPTLKCFYSGKSNIQFPNLKKVIASECPQMENFSCGTVITSKLDTVITKFEDECVWDDIEYSEPLKEVWKGDLNTSVRTVWEDLHSSTKDDQNSKEQIAAHQEVEKLKENIASSSSSK